MAVFDWLKSNWGMIAAILFLVSELLAQIPSIKANSVFQLIFGFLKKEKEGAEKQPTPAV